MSDLLWNVVREVVSPRDNRSNESMPGSSSGLLNVVSKALSPRKNDDNSEQPTLQTVVQHVMNSLSPNANKKPSSSLLEPSLAYKVVSSLIAGRVGGQSSDPRGKVNEKEGAGAKGYRGMTYFAIAAGVTVVGGTLLTHLMTKNIPEMYAKHEKDSNEEMYDPERVYGPKKGKRVNAKCVICNNDLRLEKRTALPCEHVFHTKCLYCCYVFFEVERNEQLTCPIDSCRRVVPDIILENIKDIEMI